MSVLFRVLPRTLVGKPPVLPAGKVAHGQVAGCPVYKREVPAIQRRLPQSVGSRAGPNLPDPHRGTIRGNRGPCERGESGTGRPRRRGLAGVLFRHTLVGFPSSLARLSLAQLLVAPPHRRQGLRRQPAIPALGQPRAYTRAHQQTEYNRRIHSFHDRPPSQDFRSGPSAARVCTHTSCTSVLDDSTTMHLCRCCNSSASFHPVLRSATLSVQRAQGRPKREFWRKCSDQRESKPAGDGAGGSMESLGGAGGKSLYAGGPRPGGEPSRLR